MYRAALVALCLMTAGVGQMWGWSPVYLNGDFTGGNWGDDGDGSETCQVNYELDGSNSGHYFLPLYTSAGDKYWRFCENNGSKYLNCPASDNYVMNVGTAAYQLEGGHKYNFKSTVDAGVVAVHIHQNYDGKGTSANGTNDRPRVWLERPTIYIWHNWNNNTANWNNNGGTGQKAMTDNQDGTYTYDGKFAGTSSDQNKTNVGIEGSAAIKKYFGPGAPTLVGSPTTGDKCRFTWNSSGYQGDSGETDNRGSLTITKLLTITYDKNGAGSGSAPDAQEVLYNTATATYTNTGSMTKTNMAFIGWNDKADGTGNHYDAGANITLTSNKTLYAEWVPCWMFKGGDSDKPNGSDAMGDWTPQEMTIIGTNAFMIELNLAASTSYQFKLVDRHNGKKDDSTDWPHYGNNGTMTGTTLDWTFSTSEGNCQLSTGASGAGRWRFAWNANSKVLCVYAPADAPKSSFANGKYLYFDARNAGNWKDNDFKAKFYFKNLATGENDGDITCSNKDKLDGWVYYALVPEGKTWGSVQMNRLKPSDGTFWNDAAIIYARGRSSANQNSMVAPDTGGNDITLTWGTYCPPMSSASIQNVGTTVTYGSGAGTSENPFIVATGSSIYMSASSTSALNDGNMTAYYQFKKEGSNDGDESTTNTHTFTASNTNETKEAMTVVARNGYNSAYGTASPASSAIYYEARTPYTMSYAKGSPSASISGSLADAIKVYNVAYPLPGGAIFTRTGYTQTGWATSDGGTKAFEFSGSYTGNSDQTFYPFWSANTYNVRFENLSADAGHKGSLDTTVTFNDTIHMKGPIEKPSKTHYDFDGYWIRNAEKTLTHKLIDANGNWIKDVSPYTGKDGDSHATWICAGDTTLYAKWDEHEYDITISISPAGAGLVNVGSSTTGKYETESGNITATANAGWKFKEWQFTKTGEKNDMWCADGYNSLNATIHIKAQHNGTLTAVFEPRYELAGSTLANSEVKGGMPGWRYDGTGVFTVNSTSPVNLTCTCSLNADTWYKFQIHDRIDGNFGDGKDGQYELIKGNRAHCSNATMDMKFHTTGAGKYIFVIDEIDGSNRPYVQLLWPWKVQYGWKYKDEDGSLSEGGGGTVSVTATEDGEDRSVSIGGYIMHGGHISFTATPYDDYNFAGWWTSDSYSGDPQWDSGSPTVGWDVDKEDAKAYAKFTEKTNTLTTGTTWNTAGNWSKGHVPTQDEVAVIQSPVEVDTTGAKAKKVLIMQNSPNTGQLEIPAGKELVVRTTIKKTTDGSTYGATGYDDIIIGSSLRDGNGALVMGAHDGTNKATVYFATKAMTVEQDGVKHNVNQFIGTPFNDQGAILYNYYGTKIYRFMAAHNGNLGTENEWQRVQSNEGMNGFFGYNILTNQTTEAFLEMTGTLSRTNATETISGYYNGRSNTENMFANSWVAPIYIPNFKDTCFVNIEKTIYIFNAGTPKDQGSHSTADGTFNNTSPGQYIVIPINSSEWAGDPTVKVIPSMQAFSVFAKGENPKLKFDYNELVYNPSNGTARIVPNRAPQRTNDEDAPNVLRLAATGESGYAAKIVLLERTDFTEGYDDGWDGRFLAGDDAAPQLYAVTSDGNMAINCSPEVEGTVLGFKAGTEDESYTFSFDYDGDALYLFDTQTQIYTRVLTGNTYAFTTADDAAHNRFILTHNAPQMPTVITNTLSDTKAVKFIENDHLYIFQNGRLYDAAGRIVK